MPLALPFSGSALSGAEESPFLHHHIDIIVPWGGRVAWDFSRHGSLACSMKLVRLLVGAVEAVLLIHYASHIGVLGVSFFHLAVLGCSCNSASP